MIQQVAALQNYLDSLNFEAQNKWNEIQNLNYESERLKKILCQIKKGEDYQMTHLPI